ncbi:hypothetical protein JTE90_021741 [Oedothorax gibbosus]|uniref:Uncharacterized protein n=1 Tax=Oedothorax gibbosus TaxID=931172 RepID=A0AAV6UET3_9ARAC|nr:hypothetical protein JTE90_021741 [Oedothorax gibbosus]
MIFRTLKEKFCLPPASLLTKMRITDEIPELHILPIAGTNSPLNENAMNSSDFQNLEREVLSASSSSDEILERNDPVISDSSSLSFAGDNSNESPTSEVSVSDCISPIVQDAFDSSSGTCSPLSLSADNEIPSPDHGSDLDEEVVPGGKTKFECLLMVLHIVLRHGLTSVALEDISKLLNCIIGREILPKSCYMFDKVFSTTVKPIFHFFCVSCECMIEPEEGLPSTNCPVCGKLCNLQTMNDEIFFNLSHCF